MGEFTGLEVSIKDSKRFKDEPGNWAYSDLAAELPRLLPKVIAWAEAEASAAQRQGSPLDETGIRLARAAGVRRPELVRVVEGADLPFPADAELSFAATQAGLLGPQTAGLTLGYAVFVLKGHASARLISHECRHVYQYETAGSIAAFLPLYLGQLVLFGYEKAPFEVDARAHERDIA
jgi:hypothetical protein